MSTISWNQPDTFPANSIDLTLTKHRPCPVCGNDQPREFLRIDDFQFFSDNESLSKRINLCEVQCGSCHALYMNPIFTSRGFEILCSEAGYSYGATAGRPQEHIQWLAEHGLVDAGRSLLDVGCHDGRFLAQIPKGVRRLGVDIDGPAIERGRQQFAEQGIELIHGDFNQFTLSYPPDTITLFHVLEHLPDPVATLGNLRSQAHPGTSLVVEVPVLEYGCTNDINNFFSALHMTHFSRRSLANTLTRSGWSIVEQVQHPDYNGYRVIARPSEPMNAVQGNPGDDITLQRLLAHWYDAIGNVQAKLTTLGCAEKIVVWGGGIHTEVLYQLTDTFSAECRRFLIIDSDPLKQGKSWRGIHILSPEHLADIDWHAAKLLVSSYAGTPAIVRAALANGVPHECIVTLYDTQRVH